MGLENDPLVSLQEEALMELERLIDASTVMNQKKSGGYGSWLEDSLAELTRSASQAWTARAVAIKEARRLGSGGAGLFEETRLLGRSILVILLCWLRVNWPSFVLRLYIWTERSDDCVATYSLSGSQATP